MAIKKWIGTDGSYSTSANWSPSGVPANSDTVRLPPGGGAISTGLNQSAVALTAFIVEKGYTALIASAAAPLQIGTTRFEFEGGGKAFIDLGASAVDPLITGTAQPSLGTFGLYLKGSAIDDLSVSGSSSVGVAAQVGETATVADARVVSAAASLTLGAGVTLTNAKVAAGKCEVKCAATLVQTYGGETISSETGAITTVETYDGTFTGNSSGTVTALKCHGGLSDFTKSAAARTITDVEIYPGASFAVDPAIVTLTNDPQLMGAMTINTSA